MSQYNSLVSIANTHIKRLQFAVDKLKDLMPVDAKAVTNMDDLQFMYFEVLTGRFSKLQDFVGKQLIDLFLEANKEDTANLTMIDKINKLEKFSILDSVSDWDEFRQLRNHLIHEYPDKPEITAEYLNQTYNLANALINLTQKLLGDIR